ncbi:MAG: hypothetical protein ACE5E7_14960 [Anaerolineae bacterium]
MKRNIWLCGILFALVMTACNGGGGETPTATSIPATAVPSPTPQATNTPAAPAATPTPDEYPPPPIPTFTPESYPDPPQPATQPTESYPAPGETSVWVLRAIGEQCADASQNSYADLQEAVAALTAAGIHTQQAETAQLVVCQSCGCPTSAHYRVQIDAADLDKALALDWTLEE